MKPVRLSDVTAYVEANIGSFHENRLQKLRDLPLDRILKRKNPYLFKAKNITDAHDLVKTILDAHLSSQEEALFGNFLEKLALFINSTAYGGWKSSAAGIDLEFSKEEKRHIVSIKSGPNWGNSRQVKKMADDFHKVRQILLTSNSKIEVVSVNGCCYGRDNKPLKKEGYYKLCGQLFWEFISGNSDLYLQLIVPLGHKAKQRNEEFADQYSQILNSFTLEFGQRFCADGKIDWDALVKFNSAAKPGTP